jgi:glycogen debranching enzyme
VTNGLGGYACGTVALANTRRYHGFLMASLAPPVQRTLLVAKIEVSVEYQGSKTDLSANEFAGGTISPKGFIHLESFAVIEGIPTWRYAIADALLEQRIFMAQGANTSYLRLELLRSSAPLRVTLKPFVIYRDYHSQTHGPQDFHVEPAAQSCGIQASAGARPFRLSVSHGEFAASPEWYWNFWHREEAQRGLDAAEDLFFPGSFSADLSVGLPLFLIATAEAATPIAGGEVLESIRRGSSALTAALPKSAPEWICTLARASNQFIVQRGAAVPAPAPIVPATTTVTPTAATTTVTPTAATTPAATATAGAGATATAGVAASAAATATAAAAVAATTTVTPTAGTTTPAATATAGAGAATAGVAASAAVAATATTTAASIIAGYPWFADWGRDTMISLPGLATVLGRYDVAASILKTYASFVDRGMLPNRFPDGGEAPEYNTVDATLWMFHALDDYLQAKHDLKLLGELFPILVNIIHAHVEGTRFGIHVDAKDGLLCAGEAGTQLTWMDAKNGDQVFTPRAGKAVEINALWLNALHVMVRLAGLVRNLSEKRFCELLLDRASANFGRFWNEERACLYDVIDVEGGSARDDRVRPNQILAISLPYCTLPAAQMRAVVERCGQDLLTSYGLRSLSPKDPGYIGRYTGNPAQRDAAYHMGTVWSWLLGPFACAHFRVFGDARLAQSLLDPIAEHVNSACIGTVSEILDGDAPHTARGCFAQAWSVAEILRSWIYLEREISKTQGMLK